MATTPAQQRPSPALFFDTINAHQRTASLKAALELDLFTAIGEGLAVPKALAQRCNASERGVRILCDYLTVIGFLDKQDGRYALTPDAAMFLDRRSPAYLGTSIRFLASPELMDCFSDVAAIVRKGGTLAGEHGTLGPDNPLWVEFARSMAPLVAPAAEVIAKLVDADAAQKWKVLDIAAGHGLFGIALARHNPNAEIVALDWANVLEVAKENAQRAGITARFRTIPGDAFEVDFGTGYDLVLLTNFLHHFDPLTCETFLRKVHAALNPDGRAVTLEFIPNEDRISPPTAAAFSLMMLGTTPSGDAYTFAEYDRMFRNAGFRRNDFHAPPDSLQQIVISYK